MGARRTDGRVIRPCVGPTRAQIRSSGRSDGGDLRRGHLGGVDVDHSGQEGVLRIEQLPRRSRRRRRVSRWRSDLVGEGDERGSGLMPSKAEDVDRRAPRVQAWLVSTALSTPPWIFSVISMAVMGNLSSWGVGMVRGVRTISSTRTRATAARTPACTAASPSAVAAGAGRQPHRLSRTGPAGPSCRTCPPSCGARRRSPRSRSGSCHLANPPANRWSRTSSTVRSSPGLSTTQTSGRSCHLGSGTAMTAASTTPSICITRSSMSTEEIHSPPDLMRSLVRSAITK